MPYPVRMTIVSTLAALAGGIAVAGPAAAQGLGYAIVGPAGYSGFFGGAAGLGHAAGGGEVLTGGRVGGGGEFGILAGTGGALLVTSINAVFHLGPGRATPGRSRLSPYVSGGYTRMSSGEGSFNGWNVGAGADLWFKPRVGLRVEFRDHVRPDSRGGVHYWAVRAGVALR
jgi:hypothetical protein